MVFFCPGKRVSATRKRFQFPKEINPCIFQTRPGGGQKDDCFSNTAYLQVTWYPHFDFPHVYNIIMLRTRYMKNKIDFGTVPHCSDSKMCLFSSVVPNKFDFLFPSAAIISVWRSAAHYPPVFCLLQAYCENNALSQIYLYFYGII